MGMPSPSGGGGPAVPGWLQPVVQVTTTLGVPTVIAGVLLWFVLFRLDTALKIIEGAEEDRVKIVAAMQDSLIVALDRQADRFERSIHENMALNQRLADDAKRDREQFLQRFPGK
jgi:hypothetical protein